MSQTYQTRRRAQAAPAEKKAQTAAPGPSLQELAAGAMPSQEQMGRRVDLPGAIREKMEASFGADFSGVKVFESETVAEAGANAMTMGSNIAFAPGQLDLASTSGQTLLGHELSHVVSQARGESAGRGFVADSGLEAQADRQGALAAQGESVYTGPVTPISASAVPASAAGPMQAEKASTQRKRHAMVSAGAAETSARLQDYQQNQGGRKLTFEEVAANGLRRDTTGAHENSKVMYDMFREVAGGPKAMRKIADRATSGDGFNDEAALGKLTELVNNGNIRKYLVQLGQEAFKDVDADLTPEQKSALVMSDFQNRVVGRSMSEDLQAVNAQMDDPAKANDPKIQQKRQTYLRRANAMARLSKYDIKTGKSTATRDPEKQAMYDAYLQMLADDFR